MANSNQNIPKNIYTSFKMPHQAKYIIDAATTFLGKNFCDFVSESAYQQAKNTLRSFGMYEATIATYEKVNGIPFDGKLFIEKDVIGKQKDETTPDDPLTEDL